MNGRVADADAPDLGILATGEQALGGAQGVVSDFERDYLTRLVARAGGNMSKAARQANIDRTTLYRLMEKHGLQRDEASE